MSTVRLHRRQAGSYRVACSRGFSEFAGDAKAQPVATGDGAALIAIARAGEHRRFAPVVATNYPAVFALLAVQARAAVGGRTDIAVDVAIGGPFVDVAVAVIDAIGVRREAAARRGVAEAVGRTVGVGVFGDAVALVLVEREGERPAGAATHGVFALRLAEQVIFFPGLFRQPVGIGLGFMGVHAHRRLPVALGVARLAGQAFATGTGIAVRHLVAGVMDIGLPLTAEDLEAADGEGFLEGHRVHRTFIRFAADFVLGGAHGESTGGQHDHFRAILAVLEHLARQRRGGGEGRVR